MGIHHRRAVIHRRGERCWRLAALAASALPFTLLPTLLLGPTTGFTQERKEYKENGEYRCMPNIKYECTMDQCEKTTRDFQQAELFVYNTKTNELSACLWTNCYAASATVFADTVAGTVTAIGRLTPSAHPGNEPIIVSLTIDINDAGHTRDTQAKKTGNFTAVWGYGSKGLVFDMGRCEFVNYYKIGADRRR